MTLPSPIVPPRTYDDLLGVARRFLGSYGEDLERAGKGGWDLIRAAARMWARVSQAVANCDAESYPSLATGPALATVPLVFTRPTAASGAVIVRAGTLVRASATGATFRLAADVEFGALSVGPENGLGIAIGFGEEWNVLGRYVAPDGGEIPGEVDTIDLPLLSPAFADQTIQVTNHDSGTGGRLGTLYVHGGDMNLPPIPGEADANYAGRILARSVGVSPAAVREQIRRFMEGIGYTTADWYLVEVWEHRFTSFLDAPEASFVFHPDYNPTLGVYDDPRPSSPVRGRWLDWPHAEAAGILEIRDPPAVVDWSGAYDDPTDTAAARTSSLGTWPMLAYDLTDDITTARPGVFDGGDYAREAILLRLSDLVESITAHGVVVTITAQGD